MTKTIARFNNLPIVALTAMLGWAAEAVAPVSAHDHAQSAGPVTAGLGTTHFPNSGAPRAQGEFLSGLLLLHSFEYQAARKAFQAAERTDPSVAMAYWGEALTYNQTLWGEQDRDTACAAMAKLAATPEERAAKAETARERGYLASVEQLYGERAIWLVETRGTAGPDAPPSVDSGGIASIGYFVVHDFARGITAGADTTDARKALAQLQARIAVARAAAARTAEQGVAADWHDKVTAQELQQAAIVATALDGSIQYYAENRPAGIARVREAILAADQVEFEYGPPWSVKSLDDLLGELLLADGQREEAAKTFEKTLSTYPIRRLARLGLTASQAAN